MRGASSDFTLVILRSKSSAVSCRSFLRPEKFRNYSGVEIGSANGPVLLHGRADIFQD